MKLSHNISLIDLYNLPLKFGLKQSTLKFWFFRALDSGFCLSSLDLEIDLEKNSHGFWKFGRLNYNPFEDMNKPQKSFQKRRRLIVQPNLLGN
jgi:hypothetical protein